MKLILSVILLIQGLSSCQTTESHLAPPPVTNTTVHCSIHLPTQRNLPLDIEAHFSSRPNSNVSLVLHRKNQDFPEVISSHISSNGIIFFNATASEPILIDVHEIQIGGVSKVAFEGNESVSISRMANTANEAKSVPCVFFANSTAKETENSASCNAQGTPAKGWYHDGRIVKLSASCNKELLSCADGKNSGWFLQKKKKQVLAKIEKCSWMQDSPKCVAGSKTTGWHIGDRLISRDDDCSYKHIECGNQGSKKEGWYVFEHTSPVLLIGESCRSNREISYLGH